MRPRLQPGDYLLMSRISYLRSQPARGDLVIIKDAKDPEQHFLKRIVALPGEVISVDGGLFVIDGVPLEEPYLCGLPATCQLDSKNWKVGDEQYFIMGDYRAKSTDSRHFGPIGHQRIIGKVWFRYWPIERFGFLAGA